MTTKTYSTKANARRALSNIGKAALCKAAELIQEIDGQFQFNLEAAEEIQDSYECDDDCECVVKSAPEAVVKTAKAVGTPHANMKTSLKLDRRIVCVETDEEFKNAYQMWIANPDWMTTGQQDRLTAQLYAAAKLGKQIAVEINGRSFHLLNVPEVN